MRGLVFACVCVLLAGCIARLPAPKPTRTVAIGASLLDETFEARGDWQTYLTEPLMADVVAGSYRLDTTLREYAYVLKRADWDNLIIEAEFYRRSEGEDLLYGVMCRAQTNGTGYYFLLSGNGSFSIRRGEGRGVISLVPWQPTSAINRQSARQRVRAVCVGEYLALYINDQFVGETTDSLYRKGQIGLVAAVPPRAPEGTQLQLDIDAVRVWEAQ